MDADQPLKVLFRTRPRDLLPLTGDAGARVVSAWILELSAAKRSVDLVLFLRRRGKRYVRRVALGASPPAPGELTREGAVMDQRVFDRAFEIRAKEGRRAQVSCGSSSATKKLVSA